ncbi:MAG: hypothetical protein KME21_32020 [Desmonostoc vinosum HA7617-LM4]|jgi:hypothetical protein|nr:hypothetical protein [Desmonostoc vinosum HA7617-LM4]
MNVIKYVRSLLRNPAQRGILVTSRTLAVGSACILSLGTGGGVVYKELQTHQSQRQIQINNCYLAPTPSATPTVKAKPMPKTVTLRITTRNIFHIRPNHIASKNFMAESEESLRCDFTKEC